MILGVVLVRPQHHENVGGVARSMMAFGCTNLILVGNKADLHKAAGIAIQGSTLVDNAREIDSLNEIKGRLYALLSPAEIGRFGINESYPLSECGNFNRKAFYLVIGGEDGVTVEEARLFERVFFIPTVRPHDILNMATAASIGLYQFFTTPLGEKQKENGPGGI